MSIVRDYMMRSLNSVTVDDTIEYTIKFMCKREMGVLPVVDRENKFLGTIYGLNIFKDILPEQYGFMDANKIFHEINNAAENLGEIKNRKVKDYMHTKTKTVKEKDNMNKATNVMLNNEESYLFVTNDKGYLRGFISRADLLLYLLNVSEGEDDID